MRGTFSHRYGSENKPNMLMVGGDADTLFGIGDEYYDDYSEGWRRAADRSDARVAFTPGPCSLLAEPSQPAIAA